MNICFFTPIFPPNYSGATFQALTLAKALKTKGLNIFFVALSDSTEVKSVFDGFDVYHIRVRNHAKFISGNVSALGYLMVTIRIFVLLFQLRKEYSIIHCHILGHPFTALSVIGKLLRKKIVAKISMSNEIDFRYIGRCHGRVNRALAAEFDKIVGTSSEIMRDAKDIFNTEKVELIPNGVDMKKFHPVSKERKNELKKKLHIKDRYVVTYVGGITQRKGVYSLVDIWRDIAQIFLDAVLLLVGPYGEKDGILGDKSCHYEIEKAANNIDGFQRIILTGRVNNVKEYLQVSDVFVLPSTLEGMPNVVLEAMSCGVPVVSYRISGVSDIIRSGVDGKVVESGDKQGFSKAVIHYLQNASSLEKSALEIRNSISKRFSIDEIADRYIKLYEDML